MIDSVLISIDFFHKFLQTCTWGSGGPPPAPGPMPPDCHLKPGSAPPYALHMMNFALKMTSFVLKVMILLKIRPGLQGGED